MTVGKRVLGQESGVMSATVPEIIYYVIQYFPRFLFNPIRTVPHQPFSIE